MGVRGLATFLKENRSLSKTLLLDTRSAESRGKVPIIVDAWGLVFRLYLDSLPWASGGEYLAYFRLVKRLVITWRNVGLEPVFVFDGAAPPEKYETMMTRMSQQINTARLFYTTSPGSRSSPSFSKNQSILPPMASQTFIHALKTMNVEMLFVPMGEADGVCVVMADQRAGYVLGQDSDFVILVGEGKRGRGYIPLEMVQWIEGDTVDDDIRDWQNGSGKGNSEWTTTTVRKQYPTRLSYLLPSTELINPTIILTVYPPQVLRQRLRLPAAMLPLFASLCGNDYTPPVAAEHFFEPGLNLVQRIEKVARILREQSSNTSVARAGSAGDTAFDLIKRVVKKLNVNGRPFYTEQELQVLVEAIIIATLQYTLPNVGDCCEYFPFCGELDEGCRTFVMKMITPAIEAYSNARRKGRLNVVTHVFLYPHRVPLWSHMEDPSRVSIKAGGLKEVRRKAYEVVDEAISLRWSQSDIRKDEEEVCSEENTLIDVDINNETELKELLGVADSASEGTAIEEDQISSTGRNTPFEPPSRRVITEILRSSNRMVESELHLRSLSTEDHPSETTCLRPLSCRLKLYLETFQSSTSSIQMLPVHLHPLIACLRFTIIETFPRDPLRRAEVEALIRTGIATYSSWKREHRGDTISKKEQEISYPTLSNRNSQILATLTAVMLDSITLAQALLLSDPMDDRCGRFGQFTEETITMRDILNLEERKNNENGNGNSLEKNEIGAGMITHLKPFMFFTGSLAHILLSSGGSMTDLSISIKWSENDEKNFEDCLEAITDGIEDKILGWSNTQSSSPESRSNSRLTTDPGSKNKVPGGGNGNGHGNGNKKKVGGVGSGKTKVSNGARGKSGGNSSNNSGGRFGLLEGMTS